MNTKIDIQMPLKEGSFIRGDVIERFLIQDATFTFYVNAGEDWAFSPDQEELLNYITTSTEELSRTKRWAKTVFKRNRLRLLGNSPYVYLADADVLLPETPVFGGIIEALEEYPEFGCIGLSYHPPHPFACEVACGSMMLRRHDFIHKVGHIRCSSHSCDCSYIRERLQQHGLRAVPLRESVRAQHLIAQSHQSEHPEVKYRVASDNILHRTFLEETVGVHGTNFRLVIDTQKGESHC